MAIQTGRRGSQPSNVTNKKYKDYMLLAALHVNPSTIVVFLSPKNVKIKLIIVECRSGLVWVEKGGQRQGGEGSKGVNFGSPPFLYLTSSVIITDFELGLFIIKG